MNAHRVVSVHRDRCQCSADRFHITTICTGKSANACSTWTTNEILAGLERGDSFYVQTDEAGKRAEVRCVLCPDCNEAYALQSVSDASGGLWPEFFH
jgi:hypothetical protein